MATIISASADHTRLVHRWRPGAATACSAGSSFQRRDDFTGTGEALFRATGETPQNRRLPKRIHVRHVDTRARRRLVRRLTAILSGVSPRKGNAPVTIS